MREKTIGTEKIKHGLLKVAGYLVFLIQSVPVWTGLMTLPFAVHLVMIFTNLSVNLPIALYEFFSPFLSHHNYILNSDYYVYDEAN
jgi:hypothetical protein